MAAPTVGSSQANSSGGEQFNDIRFAAARQLADGSYSMVSASAAIWNYKSCNGAATYVTKSAAGQLYGFYVGTAAGNITIYDNTSAAGTKILDTSAVPTAGTTYVLPVSFGTGLTIVLSGAANITALYL